MAQKTRISSRDSDGTPRSAETDDEFEDEGGIDDILAAALRDDLEGLNNFDLEATLKGKNFQNFLRSSKIFNIIINLIYRSG